MPFFLLYPSHPSNEREKNRHTIQRGQDHLYTATRSAVSEDHKKFNWRQRHLEMERDHQRTPTCSQSSSALHSGDPSGPPIQEACSLQAPPERGKRRGTHPHHQKKRRLNGEAGSHPHSRDGTRAQWHATCP
mmetsp:Transcript_43776/g.86359  ORF Transcript_43776/g.86359 Transcript_43776/m.86359 type:complete len:132 (+) Transcript_43776:337-732(+)